jgi:hypothetical protein
LRQRIVRGGGRISLLDPNGASSFQDVLRSFAISGVDLILTADHSDECPCRASWEGRWTISFTGYLYRGPRVIGFIQRSLSLGKRVAEHKYFFLVPAERGGALGFRLLQRSFELYDALGLEAVRLQADLELGKWLWARAGFEFESNDDYQRVDQWFRLALARLGLPDDTSGLTRASDYALFRKQEGDAVTFAELRRAIPERATEIKDVADKNGIDLADPQPIAKAIMVSGPPWLGRLHLQSPERAVFDQYAASRVQLNQGAPEAVATSEEVFYNQNTTEGGHK